MEKSSNNSHAPKLSFSANIDTDDVSSITCLDKFKQNWKEYFIGDWIVIIIIGILIPIIMLIPPYGRVITSFSGLEFPLVEPFPSDLTIYLCSFLIPFCFFFLYYLATRFIKYFHIYYVANDFIHSIMGFAQCILSTFLLSEIMRRISGRPRPNFKSMCEWDDLYGCTCSELIEHESRMSFPCKFSAFLFSGLGYLSIWILGKSKFRQWEPNTTYKVYISSLPIFLAGYFSLFHFDDVVAGSIIGVCLSILTYSYHYPSPWDKNSHQPLSEKDSHSHGGRRRKTSKRNSEIKSIT